MSRIINEFSNEFNKFFLDNFPKWKIGLNVGNLTKYDGRDNDKLGIFKMSSKTHVEINMDASFIDNNKKIEKLNIIQPCNINAVNLTKDQINILSSHICSDDSEYIEYPCNSTLNCIMWKDRDYYICKTRYTIEVSYLKNIKENHWVRKIHNVLLKHSETSLGYKYETIEKKDRIIFRYGPILKEIDTTNNYSSHDIISDYWSTYLYENQRRIDRKAMKQYHINLESLSLDIEHMYDLNVEDQNNSTKRSRRKIRS